ncbi:hypothetical protein SLG_24430 [Sphingobium sp. SYK-6]|nr:hypothetical protein SLG_24430 [Sphingobium sp. SYK-6]
MGQQGCAYMACMGVCKDRGQKNRVMEILNFPRFYRALHEMAAFPAQSTPGRAAWVESSRSQDAGRVIAR